MHSYSIHIYVSVLWNFLCEATISILLKKCFFFYINIRLVFRIIYPNLSIHKLSLNVVFLFSSLCCLFFDLRILITNCGVLWSWWYAILIFNYLCNQCLSPLMMWVRTRLWRGVLDATLCDKVCQGLATDRWFSLVYSTIRSNATISLKYCWKWR
jgi:hypothetical protein